MRSDIRNQKRQRQAVVEALSRHKVVVSSARFRTGLPTITRVLVGGDYYDVSDDHLAKLQGGATPAALGLSPIADEQP